MFILLLFGCAHKILVEIPPRIDLQSYQTIGIVEFSSNSTDQLNEFATQKFMAMIQTAQPQVRFLELGSQEQLLKAIGHDRMDPEAVKAIGKKYGVKTIFGGTYEISEVKPRVSLGEDLSSINASAVVNVSMTSKHWDTETGATIWTHSRYGEWPLASVKKGSGSAIFFSVSDPEDKYGQFIGKLAYAVTDDFRAHYEKRVVPKK
jgi:L,D-peptidoglycan transpeptidase YkuD (ErfK/YbiS/YcfS/YnhG family)